MHTKKMKTETYKKNTLLIIYLKKKKTSNEGAKMQDLMTYVAIKHIYKMK